MRRPLRLPLDLLLLLPLALFLAHCGEGLGPDPDEYPPMIDRVENLSGEPIQSAPMGETVNIVGSNFTPAARVLFGKTEAEVQGVNAEGTTIVTTVPAVESPGPLLLHVEVDGRKSNEVSFQITSSYNLHVGLSPTRVDTADLDGDGNLDLVVGHWGAFSGFFTVFLGKEEGGFREPIVYGADGFSQVLAIADLDADGRLDLVAFDLTAGGIGVWRGKGDGSFLEPIVHEIEGGLGPVAVGDLDGDGNLDLVGYNYTVNTIVVFLGNGDGTLRDGVTHDVEDGVSTLVVDDFNGDGDPDLAVATDWPEAVAVLPGNGDGTFRDPTHSYAVGDHPSAMVSGDLNNDGHLDLVVVNKQSNDLSILVGNGDGTFLDAVGYRVGEYPSSVALGDLDGDGDLDLAVADEGSDDVAVLLNQGDGTFGERGKTAGRRFLAGRSPAGVALGDLNGDGDIDLAVANHYSQTVSILPGNGDGTFGTALNCGTGHDPMGLAAADLDGDGDLDLAVAFRGHDRFRGGVSVLLGNGDGTFQEAFDHPAGWKPTCLVAGDLDGDGNQDLAVAYEGRSLYVRGGLSILMGNGDGTFQDPRNYRIPGVPVSLSIGDLDGSGEQDLAVLLHDFGNLPEPQAGISVFLGNGDGTFRRGFSHTMDVFHTSMALGDLDGDDVPDLALTLWTSENSGRLSLLIGNGDGSFQEPLPLGDEEGCPRSVAMADLDGDGDRDLAVANYGPLWVFDPPLYPEDLGHASVYSNDGDGSFAGAVYYPADGNFSFVATGDLDGDGDEDLALTSWTNSSVIVMLGNGDGSFRDPANYIAGLSPEAALAGDFDGDGDDELAVTGFGDYVTILFAGN